VNDRQYYVDATGVITWVDDGWDEFARENGGTAHVLAAEVIGRPVLDFVSGSALTHLWTTLMARVGTGDRPFVISFRCDAPTRRRLMQMLIEPHPAGGLRFVTTVVQGIERPRARIIETHAQQSHGRLLVMCSWCKRLQAHERWLEVEDAAEEFGLFEADELPDITHGLCPSCEQSIMAELEKSDIGGRSPSAPRVDR
jgi:hypothetical protein